MNHPVNDVATAAPGSGEDVQALTWVQDEVRRSLDSAHKAVQRHLREAESLRGSDVDEVDPAVLRSARSHLHQAAGALELIGLQVPAALVRAGEQAVQRLAARPATIDARAAETLERAWFALGDYLARLGAGKPVCGVSLFPQYRALLELGGADRIHPADLWEHDWRWRVIAGEAEVGTHVSEGPARELMERLILRLMRTPDRTTLRRMSDLCAALGVQAKGRRATMWRLAAGFFEAQAAGLLRQDVYVKRAAPRLLAQARLGMQSGEVSDRLARDLLFFCALAVDPPGGVELPRLRAVRLAYGLGSSALPDYEMPTLGRFDPAWIALARKRAGAARDAWSAAAGEEPVRSHGLAEAFALLRDSLERLYPNGDELGQALTRAVQSLGAGQVLESPLAMEVATAILYVEASLEEGLLDDPELPARVRRLAHRIDAVRQGGPAMPLDAWMEQLYRRVSDAQTIGSVVEQLRSMLAEVEQTIDRHYREPERPDVLAPVPAWLGSMRGVLSVLGLDAATQTVQRMREDVEQLAQEPADGAADALQRDPQRFDRLADNLGTLGFLVDVLAAQPLLAKTMFRFDAAQGRLRSWVARPPGEDRGTEPAVDSPGGEFGDRLRRLGRDARDDAVSDDALVAELRSLAQHASLAEERRLAETLAAADSRLAQVPDAEARRAVRNELAATLLRGAIDDEAGRTAAPAAPASVDTAGAEPSAPGPAGQDRDADMLEVFLEEASEVVAQARRAVVRLEQADRDEANDLADMTAVRRAFHTLKGSSRMVGLTDFGEAAWACEQLYNARLAHAPTMDGDLRRFTLQALAYLEGWTSAIRAGEVASHDRQPLVAAADAMRIESRLVALPLPTLQAVVEEASTGSQAAEAVAAQPGEPSLARQTGEPLEERPAVPAGEPTPEAGVAPGEEPQAGAIAAPIEDQAAEPAVEPIEAAADQLAAARPAEPIAEPEPLDAAVGVPPQAAAAHPSLEPAWEPVLPTPLDEPVKVIGPLRVGIAMFNIFLNEADERSRQLSMRIAEWATQPDEPPAEAVAALAHSLAGSSATVGYHDLATLARALEHALTRSNEAARVADDEPALYTLAADEIRRLLHQFAAGFLSPVRAGLVERLDAHQPEPARADRPADVIGSPPAAAASRPAQAAEAIEVAEASELPAAAWPPGADDAISTLGRLLPQDDDIDLEDTVDTELFPVFVDEAEELLPELQSRMREWVSRPDDRAAAGACMRTLHTFKGAARLAGAMRLGEMAHRLETSIELLLARDSIGDADVEPLEWRVDALEAIFHALCEASTAGAPPRPELPFAAGQPGSTALALEPAERSASREGVEAGPPTGRPAAERPLVDWAPFLAAPGAARGVAPPGLHPATLGAVRVKSTLLDRLVNHAGEASIARTRIESDLGQIKSSLADLADNLERLRGQLRDVEVQAESQISSRLEAAKAAALDFDPLEMDRYTRVQELTRMMAESVNDVATVQRSLQRALQSSEDQVALQGRLTRALQDDLMRTRMVEFESLSDRLYRVVRQTAKETAKQVRLDIVGGSIEIDRGVLERMTAPFEHLLRNSIVHGIERPAQRRQAGKDADGLIEIKLVPEGNEVAIEFRDDGAGLDLPRIRARAHALGLVALGEQLSDAAACELIFAPGFSTAERVTEIAGRGVGMDVVRSEVLALGGRVQTSTTPGQGTAFRMILPLTTAVTQVIMLRCGGLATAVPSNLVEVVCREPARTVEAAYREGRWMHDGEAVPFHWLGALLGGEAAGTTVGRDVPVVIVRSAAQRVAVHVDEVLGHQEVVVKNLGPQLARLPGLAGMTLLPSGSIATIYNPVALVAYYGEAARARLLRLLEQHPGAVGPVVEEVTAPPAPLVLVVDDSLTVRRVTQRLLARAGYRVATAKDGIEGLERIAEERPRVILSDIEMPHMDGFEFVRKLRADPALAGLPVIMITSRIAQKHRDYARELGIEHYLGKPYGEEEVLALVARLARRELSRH